MAEAEKGTWATIKPDLVKLLTVGVLGSLLSGLFGYVTWQRDKRLDRLEDNIKAAEQIHADAIALTHERWYRGFRLLDQLGQSVSPPPDHEERLKDAARLYDDAVIRWNIGEAGLLSRLEMAVDSAMQTSAPVSLRDISKVACQFPLFQDAQGRPIPELNPLSVKAWHIGLSHCFGEFNAALWTLRQKRDLQGKIVDEKAFHEALQTARKMSADLYVNASLYRTTFLQRLMELKAKEVVYVEGVDLKPYFALRKNPDKTYIPMN